MGLANDSYGRGLLAYGNQCFSGPGQHGHNMLENGVIRPPVSRLLQGLVWPAFAEHPSPKTLMRLYDQLTERKAPGFKLSRS